MDGGKKLGQGLHGTAYDVSCDEEGDSFCSMIKDKNITKIVLYTQNGDKHVLDEEESIDKFIAFLPSVKGKIAKLFKAPSAISFNTLEKELKLEIQNNIKVIDIYKPKASKYVTTIGISGFFRSPIVGGIVEISGKPLLFTAFGTKCDSLDEIDEDKFILDILESLSKLQTKGYFHNDIKLGNIVVCDDTYKLIDWGFLRDKTKLEYTSLSFTNPIKWYIKGYTTTVSKSFLEYGVTPKSSKYKFVKTDIFKKFKKRIYSEFDQVVSDYSRAKLKDIYKDTYDVYMFGCTILEIIEKFKLEDPKYLELAYALTSLTDPVEPKQALKLAKKVLKQ